MPWVGLVIGGAVSALGSMGAAGTEAGAAQGAQQLQAEMFQTIQAQEQPWMNAGRGAQGELNNLLGIIPPGEEMTGGQPTSSLPGFGSLTQPFTMQDWQQLSPMYNFQLQQGQQGVLGADAPGQGAESGAALKDLMSFNQGTANSSFNNAFQLYQQQQGNIYNRLFGVSQLGQNAAANTGQQGTTLAGNAGQAMVGAGNAIGTGISNAANAAAGSANQYAWLSALQNQGGGVPWNYGLAGGTMGGGFGE